MPATTTLSGNHENQPYRKERSNPRGRPAGRSAAQTRAILIEAAEQHFEEASYADVKMGDIAESAGFSGAAIYNHFSSKDDLFLAAVIKHIERYNRTVGQAVSCEGSWKARYNALLEAVQPLQGTGSGVQNLGGAVMARLKEQPEKFRQLRKLREKSASYFQELIAQGIEEGDFPPETDVRIAGQLLMAITIGASNTVTFYNPGSDEIVASMLKTLLGTATPT